MSLATTIQGEWPLRSQARRRKVLHVVGSMDRGGVETWLMHVIRNMNKEEFEHHFLVETNREAAYDREILSLGGHIHQVGNHRDILSYASNFTSITNEYGPFDVIHSHVYTYSGFVMRLAKMKGIPIRIAHSHTARSAPRRKISRLLYEKLMRTWIRSYATHRIGVCEQAGEALFGSQRENPFTVLYYGFDFSRFLRPVPVEQLKRRWQIPPHRKVIGHVGRLVPVKNHAFIIECVEEVLNKGLDVHLLCVGGGPLFESLQVLVESRGLSDRCTLAGVQADVPPFLAAMDILLLPSCWEGLGIVTLEAQAAGVPVLASAAVPIEVDVIPGMVQHLSLNAGPRVWAETMIRTLQQPARVRTGNEAILLQSSRFGLEHCLNGLTRIYHGFN
jgi:glycosyltransferase involved in cell wall biosynthesis